jgi:E3 ubiquitin-protein ligase MARCH6
LRDGFVHVDPISATKNVILPLAGGLLAMLVLPAGVLALVQRWTTIQLGGKALCKSDIDSFRYFLGIDECISVIHVYPGIFAIAGFSSMASSLQAIYESWQQGIRDQEFLVEMRLQNFEKDKKHEDEIIALEETLAMAPESSPQAAMAEEGDWDDISDVGVV